MTFLQPLSVILISYIIGSFPTAYLVGKANKINIFEVGSGNMGTNNVLRSLGVKWGALVLAIDSGKGILAVSLSRLMGDPISSGVLGAIFVIVGHNWSVLATLITGKLRGGKGVATACGTWIMMAPYWQLVVVVAGVYGVVVLFTRYMSLGALVAVAISTIWMAILIREDLIPNSYSFYVIFVSAMIYVRHWKNIRALLMGRERRLGERA